MFTVDVKQQYNTTIKKIKNLQSHAGVSVLFILTGAKLQWLEHLWNHENMFEAGTVRANEC